GAEPSLEIEPATAPKTRWVDGILVNESGEPVDESGELLTGDKLRERMRDGVQSLFGPPPAWVDPAMLEGEDEEEEEEEEFDEEAPEPEPSSPSPPRSEVLRDLIDKISHASGITLSSDQ